MELLKQMAFAFIMLIQIGAVLRIVFCLIKVSTSEEEAGQYKKRAKNTAIFAVIAECVWIIKDLIVGYYL